MSAHGLKLTEIHLSGEQRAHAVSVICNGLCSCPFTGVACLWLWRGDGSGFAGLAHLDIALKIHLLLPSLTRALIGDGCAGSASAIAVKFSGSSLLQIFHLGG